MIEPSQFSTYLHVYQESVKLYNEAYANKTQANIELACKRMIHIDAEISMRASEEQYQAFKRVVNTNPIK